MSVFFRGKTHLEVDPSGTRADAVGSSSGARPDGARRLGHQKFMGPAPERLTFEDLRRIAEDQNALKPRKAERSWRASWKALDGFFAGTKAIAIDHAKLTEYVAYRLSMHRARGTIRNELAAIRQALKKAALDGKALVPTFPSVEESKPRKGFFEVDAYTALLDRLPEDIQAVIAFLRETGWRLNEALSLEWRQVDLGTKIVRLDPGMTKNDEGGTSRTPCCPRSTRSCVRSVSGRASRSVTGGIISLVFHDQGRPIRTARFYRAWWRAAKAAGVYREWRHAETGKARSAGRSRTIFDGPPCETSSPRAFRTKSRWRSPGTRLAKSSTVTTSSARRTRRGPIERLAALRDTQTRTPRRWSRWRRLSTHDGGRVGEKIGPGVQRIKMARTR